VSGPRSSRRSGGTVTVSVSDIDAMRRELAAAAGNEWLLRESIADLERQLVDPGWRRLIAESEQEFTPEGLRQMRKICRLYAIKNPLIRRGVALRAAYVWGQGVSVTARSNGNVEGQQDVNRIVQAFWSDRGNQASLTGVAAQQRLERTLGVEGGVAIMLFTAPNTGRVRVRTCSVDEIVDTRTNPDDHTDVMYYKRQWQQRTYDQATGVELSVQTVETYHPALGYLPGSRPTALGGIPVKWDAPMILHQVNGLHGWQHGVPDVYAALDWSRAYNQFLEDWARLMKSLSRYAWRAKTSASSRAATRTAIAAAPGVDPMGRPLQTGATALIGPADELEAISKTGATLDADSGRPLACMVAAALDIPVTMLLADPGQTGARATAETLDRPTELVMELRQRQWGEILHLITDWVIWSAVKAPNGKLAGSATVEDDAFVVELDGGTDPTVDIAWPDLAQVDQSILIKAITDASGTGTMPPELVLRLLLEVLGVADVDSILAVMLDDNGRFLWPSQPGQSAALAALLAGGDPAASDGGPMGRQPQGDGAPASDGGTQ
jgi:hypothetical protein